MSPRLSMVMAAAVTSTLLIPAIGKPGAKVDTLPPAVVDKKKAEEVALQKLREKKDNKPRHPINDVVHAHDLTLQLQPLDPHKLNNVGHVNQHVQAVIRMAKQGGLDGSLLEETQNALRDHMRSYQTAKAKLNAYNKRKQSLPPLRREQMEHAMAENARALHHSFYRIKMRVISAAKSDAPFERLREVMKSDKFTDEDRANFEAEIAEHIQDRENFAKAQARRNRSINGTPDVSDEKRDEHVQIMRRAVVHHQKRLASSFKTLSAKIMVHAGEL